jgi:hypothetical protein
MIDCERFQRPKAAGAGHNARSGRNAKGDARRAFDGVSTARR